MRTVIRLAVVWAVVCGAAARADPPLRAEKQTDPKDFSWLREITEKVPPLRNDRGGRWPMILWEGLGYDPLPVETHRALLARGIVQNIRLDEKMIPAALALQQAGAPVIMMQGSGGPWPAQLAGKPELWAHELPPGEKPRRLHACPAVFTGWAIEADRIRQTLGKFKEAGVTVDAVWMDWEGEPMDSAGYDQAVQCERCRRTLPPSVLRDERAWRRYCFQLSFDLLGAYLAGPVREIYPSCSLTNWALVVSTPERPVRPWYPVGARPPMVPSLFNATNPIVYGNTVFISKLGLELFKDQEQVDQAYFHLLVRQVSDDAANRAAWRPELKCFPWVSRWCPDDMDPAIPIMSRERYREALRHVWLRGADGMQVFQPRRPGYMHIVVTEVEDAVSVYDEMLAFRAILEGGTVLNTAVPALADPGVVWSGVRSGDRAVVRAFKQGGGEAEFEAEIWPGLTARLKADAKGATWLLTREGDRMGVESR